MESAMPDNLAVAIEIDCESEVWKVDSLAEADARLDDLHNRMERPTVVLLKLDRDELVEVVVGAERSTLQFMPNPPDPPYFVPVGELNQDEPFVYFYRGHWSECSTRNTVPIETARQLVRQLADTRALPRAVEWEPA
jgi:hypothetical protein